MHGRSCIAVIVAAVPALVFAVLADKRAFAEDAKEQPAATPKVVPERQAAAPQAPKITQVPTVAVPAPALSSHQQAAKPPNITEAQPAPTPDNAPSDAAPAEAAATQTQAAETQSPAAASPAVEKVRALLADPAAKAAIPPEDLAALQAFYASRAEPLWTTPMGFTAKAQGIIDEIAKADEWGLSAAAFQLPPSGDLTDAIDEEAAAETKLAVAILRYARHARGGRVNPASVSRLIDQSPPLKDPQMVLSEIATTEDPDAYLRSLHPKHEQFHRLREALLKARGLDPAAPKKASPSEVQRILINMERWRWMPEDLGAFYVQDNVPEFMLYVVKDGKTIHSDKMVVGKLAYATPVFSADMRSIVFNPEWTVPPTIVREDLLPRLRRGGGGWFGGGGSVLKQHGLKVKYNGRVVDPGSINWSSVNMASIAFVQAPGPTNVLGKLKFLYPNKHIVYMHDTIKPNLFKSAVRAEGHNCIRMEKPAKLAEILLAEDKGWGTQKIQELLAKGYDAAVVIDKPFPVHTTYFTAHVDDEGNVVAFNDIYGLDRKVAAAVLGKPAPIADDVTSSIAQRPEPAPVAETQAEPEPKPKKKNVAAENDDLFDMAR